MRARLLVWTLVLGVFCGLAALSGQFTGPDRGSGGRAAVRAPGQVLVAATFPVRVAAADDTGGSGTCSNVAEAGAFLPIHRWTSFSLGVVDNAAIAKTRLFMSVISSLLFMAGDLIWRILAVFMGFGYTYDMVCSAAPSINAAAGMIAEYAAWFMIPGWVVVLAAAARRSTDRWSTGVNKGPWAAIRLVMVFLVASGMVFFLADQSNRHRDDPLSAYTAPWMAASVQKAFDRASTSLLGLGDLATVQTSDKGAAFYDTDPATAGKVSCAALDAALYTRYHSDNGGTAVGTSGGSGAMEQVSRLWETSYLRSWIAAQFGDGSTAYPAPAHAACRLLEANSDVTNAQKWEAYDLATGNPVGTTNGGSWRGFYLTTPQGRQTVMVAWGACMADGNGLGSGHTIPQWDAATAMLGKARACGMLYSGGGTNGLEQWWNQTATGLGDLGLFYFNGDGELGAKLGNCVSTSVECAHDWAFVDGWLGGNESERLTQSMLSLVVAIVFLMVLGPMAIGLMLISDALAILVILLSVTLILFALGNDLGKRLLRLTGAAAAGKFVFMLALTFLMMFIAISYAAVTAAFGGDTPSFVQQVLQAGTPLIALLIFKRLSKAVGLGNLGTMAGALGFAGAAALTAVGEQRSVAQVRRGVAGAADRVQAGLTRHRNSALDERSLLRKLVRSNGTRRPGTRSGLQPGTTPGTQSGAKSGAPSAVQPSAQPAVRPGAKPGAQPAVQPGATPGAQPGTPAGAVRPGQAGAGGPGQRAAAYAGLAAGMATRTSGQGTGVAGNGADPRPAGATTGHAAGAVLTKDARLAQRQADDWQRKIAKVDRDDRRDLEFGRTYDVMDAHRARQWGKDFAEGLNEVFRGFGSTAEMARAHGEMAVAMGLPEDRIMIGGHGLALPVPAFVDQGGHRVFAPGTTVEQAAHPVHFLDAYTLRRRQVEGAEETDAQYCARLAAVLSARGMITEGGEAVNVFDAHGFDTADTAVRERIAAYIEGAADTALSNISVTARRPEGLVVRASREWAEEEGARLRLHEERDVRAMNELMESARREIRDFARIEVGAPSGSAPAMRVSAVRAELDRHFDELAAVNAEVRELCRRQESAAPLPRAEFDAKLTALSSGYNEHAREIDGLSGRLREAIDVSRAARGVCRMRADLGDPAAPMDAAEAAEAARRLTGHLERRRKELHELVDRQVGRLHRTPDSSREADDAAVALREFRRALDVQIAAEERANKSVLGELRALDALHGSRAATDPRRPVARPPKARAVLAAQRGARPGP